jgi:hypothetical protein
VPGGLISIGFSTTVPDFAAIKAGPAPEPIGTDAPALVLWAHYYGNRAGDTLSLAITGPAGEVIRDTQLLDRTQAQAFRAAGKRLSEPPPAGGYRGTAILLRDGVEIDRMETVLTVAP